MHSAANAPPRLAFCARIMYITRNIALNWFATYLTPAELAANFRATAMVKDRDITAAVGDVVSAYILPMLDGIDLPYSATYTVEDGDDYDEFRAWLLEVSALVFARLLVTSAAHLTEYAAAKPNKREAAATSSAELSAAVAAYRRKGMAALYRYAPITPKKYYAILGEEL